MNSGNNYRKNSLLILILLLYIFVFMITSTMAADEINDKITDMRFREADIREVLTAISEAAGVNLVLDGTVSGEVSVHLRDISFDKALKMVTQIHNYDYKWDEETIFVATPERIQNIYVESVTEIIDLKNVNLDDLKDILTKVYSDINVQINKIDGQLIITGRENLIDNVLKLLDRLHLPPESKTIVDRKKVLSGELTEIHKILDLLYPELKIVKSLANNLLIFQGNKEIIDEARMLAKELDNSFDEIEKDNNDLIKEEVRGEKEEEKEEIEYTLEIIKVNSTVIDSVFDIIKSVYPDLFINIQKEHGRLIIKGPTALVEKGIELAKRLDIEKPEEVEKPEERVEEPVEPEKETRVINIKYTDIESLSEIVTGIYTELSVQISSATDQLIIHGLEEDIEKAENLIRQIDVKDLQLVEEKIRESKNIKYAEPEKVKEELKQLFPDIEIEVENSDIVITALEDRLREALTRAEEIDNKHQLTTEVLRINYLDLEEVKEVIEGNLSELNIQIESGNQNLVITGRINQVNQARDIINKMDNPRRQVLLEVQIEEVQRDRLAELGPDFQGIRNLSGLNFIKTDTDSLDVQVSWPSILRILETKDFSQTLANPSLMANDREEARLLIGDQVPYEITEEAEDRTITRYEYQDVGIILEFEPRISDDDVVILYVKPEISSIGPEVGHSPLPQLRTREVETQISLRDGEGFAIAGLIQDDVIQEISQIPILSNIPLLGRLFRSTKEETVQTEIVIFITAHIIDPLSDGEEKPETDSYVPADSEDSPDAFLDKFFRFGDFQTIPETKTEVELDSLLDDQDQFYLNFNYDDYFVIPGRDNWIITIPLF